jgi:4-amino-4-deoxy-L-arabinose transferase-like glycosyltransferase
MSLTEIPRRSALIIGAIVLGAAILLFNRLGTADICTGNEAVEAVFVQQMVEHGHLLFPLENGRQPMYKPPLFHWSATALDRLTGQRRVTASNLRAAAAMYALGGIVMTMAFAMWLLGIDAAILAGLILAASYQYIDQGRFGRVDMTLCFFEAAALFAFVWWMPPRRDAGRAWASDNRNRLYLLALAMGLAVLSKGPVGAILPGAAMLIFLVAERRWSRGRSSRAARSRRAGMRPATSAGASAFSIASSKARTLGGSSVRWARWRRGTTSSRCCSTPRR